MASKRDFPEGFYILVYTCICNYKCQYCQGKCRRAGKQRNGAQKFYCGVCKKYQQADYKRRSYNPETNNWMGKLVRESVGIRGIGRLLRIGTGTVLRRIRQTAGKISRPVISKDQNSFEVDELWTYVGNKQNEIWVAYAYNKTTDRIEDFVVGRRTKSTLRVLIERLLLSGVKKIYTDRLTHYSRLIPKDRHRRGVYCTNHIERKNLTIRTHLKRLGRKTICFSRCAAMLESCLRIYFWNR